MSASERQIQDAYKIAQDRYAELGINTESVLKALDEIPISIQCWQGDDVLGFENKGGSLSGGIATTGNYPGRATTPDQLRADLEVALGLIPGAKRVNLHAIYLESPTYVERDQVEAKHFQGWIDWAKQHNLGLDFNPTLFSHANAADGLTLAHPDAAIRKFWVDHTVACARISEEMGKQLNNPATMNIWIPDGFKDNPADRATPRALLVEALDEIKKQDTATAFHKNAVEGKLFGIGAESYTVGSNDFYMGYAATRKTLLTLDAGHFHPTENVGDKISTALLFVPEILLHVSRPVRWDSDHVVILDDALQGICNEIIRSKQIEKIHIGLDFFDASINRIAAWTIGTRNTRKALLIGMLESAKVLVEAEHKFDFTKRLAISEEDKSMPWAAVWEYYCLSKGIPAGREWYDVVTKYEKDVLSKR
jgi:L-rhamnose isomerase